jgi:hypothetical protein
VPTYVLGTFYIRFFLYQGYDIPVSGEAHCTLKIHLDDEVTSTTTRKFCLKWIWREASPA